MFSVMTLKSWILDNMANNSYQVRKELTYRRKLEILIVYLLHDVIDSAMVFGNG